MIYLYECNFKNSKDKVGFYFLCEHQFSPVKHMPIRMLKYNQAIMESHLKNNDILQIIINFVFYHGKLAWNYPLGLSSYYQDPKLAKEYFYMAPFTLINLQSGISEDLYTDPNLGGYCMAFHSTSQQDPYQTFKQGLSYPGFADALAGMPIQDKILITQYIVQCVDASKYSLSNVLDLTLSGASNNKEECMNSIAYTFIQQGIQQGMQQGILNVARNMITAGETIDKVILFTGLSKAIVQKLYREN